MPKADLGFIDRPFALSTDLHGVQEVRDDEDLLVLTERATMLIRQAREQFDSWPISVSREVNMEHGARLAKTRREMRAMLRRAGKLRAHTPAGLYAKAQLVLNSHTGAAILAKSLAADMIEMPGLRQRLWPAEVA